jgi:serine/threonine-protein kinase
MTLSAGTNLGQYEVVEAIGAGGMGEVYRARDTKLGREVAIKVLPDAFAENEERLARFEREARLLASLNHPNIAALYGLEQSDGVQFLVMELADGETLGERLRRGPIPVEDALPIFKQIAEALEGAHEKGIIHRDLKPANIKVSSEGKVKVLDFGLAKAMSGDPVKNELSESPTITRNATATGVVLGTAAYMAPEQARGKSVDQRADIWAFGVVLYEMLTGRHAFEAEDVTLTLAAVVTSEPDHTLLPSDLSPSLKRFLGRCLEKDPRKRVQAIGDMRLALEGAFETGFPRATSPVVPRHRVALPWLIAAGAIIVALWAIVSERRAQNAVTTLPRPQRSFTIDSVEGTIFPRGVGPVIAISPDGETVLYSAEGGQGRQLYRRSLADFEATPIRGTEGASRMPFFSPDGKWVAFGDSTLTEIKRVPLTGGEPFVVCNRCDEGHWGDAGSIVFGRDGTVFRVPETGGEPEAIVEPMPERGIVALARPNLLPGGASVLFDINPFDCGGIGVVSLESQELIVVTDNGTDPFYSPSGHILFARDRTLHAVPFDLARLEVTGPETPVLSGVRVENGGSV